MGLAIIRFGIAMLLCAMTCTGCKTTSYAAILYSRPYSIKSNQWCFHIMGNELIDAVERRLLESNRYRWLRREFLAGRERDISEGLNNEQELDEYIDHRILKEFGEKDH